VADEVWIALAQLHFNNPEVEDFTAGKIVDRVLENLYFGSLRPGVSIHISQHCVADKSANPGNYLMLASSPQPDGRNRRLFRRGDIIGRGREGGKRVPYLSQIPSEHKQEVKRLLEWWSRQGQGYAFDPQANPEEGTTPVKVRQNQIRLGEDIYPFFAEHPELGPIGNIRDLEIAEYDSEGNSINRYKNRQTSIKVGYALSIIVERGLLKSFEGILSDSGRSIKDSYGLWYQANENQLRSSQRLSDWPKNSVSLADDTVLSRPSLRRARIGIIPPEPQIGIHDSGLQIGSVAGNQIHLQKDIRPFLELYSPENVQLSADDAPLPISELGEDGKPTAYYKDRTVTIRVGYLLTLIRSFGLIGEFEDLLEETGRTISPRYEQLYRQNILGISTSSNP
jgi:hypothetical protein